MYIHLCVRACVRACVSCVYTFLHIKGEYKFIITEKDELYFNKKFIISMHFFIF